MSTFHQQPGVSSSSRQPSPSPTSAHSSRFLQPNLPGPSSVLRRANSHSSSSQPSGRIPSPRPPLPASSRSTCTPTTSLSRQSSLKEEKNVKPSSDHAALIRQMRKGSSAFSDEGWKSPMSESGSAEVIETQAVRLHRDQDTGRWMVNQYRVLREIGHGTHGRVRLGEDLSEELPVGSDDGDVGLGISSGGPYYAIKIVDRNPKKKRLTGLGRHKGGGLKSGRDGAKLLNESEIRKEIAIFKKVNHPNVVRMKEIIDDPESSKIYMIMEWCENGEIRWKEAEGLPALTVGESRKIFRDTLLGLEYLHHQGIIHRDIKPSNLLRSADDTVKISDFGCSHFSEALRAAAAQPGPEGDAYVDDIELAKTAGSPAFFAPEMCYSGLDTDIAQRSSSSPQSTPVNEVPSFTLRPPSVAATETKSSQSDPLVGGGSMGSAPLRPTLSNDSVFSSSRRPPSARSHSSSATIQRRERLPITNAIDVWALGVTLYCLLFGKTPFDAANEYLLMQVIPVQDYVVPPFMGKDRMSTGTGGIAASDEAKECLDLLARLMEKDPAKRITLEQAKKHPFTLRGLSDPASWLARTDPHTQTFVTVSNDEVAAVITKSTGFRDKFRKGIKSISHKLQLLGGGSNRPRSRSIGETDSPVEAIAPSQIPSAVGTPRSSKLVSSLAPSTTTPTGIATFANRDVSPMNSPLPAPPSLSRRFSLLGAKLISGDNAASQSPPQPTTSGGVGGGGGGTASPSVSGQTSPESASDVPTRAGSVASIQSAPTARGFVVHRRPSTHLVPPSPAMIPSAMVPLAPEDTAPRSPRPVASSSSLDKFKHATSTDLSPNSSLRRRGSSEIDVMGRQRSHSNASSISSKLARLLRSGSQRSKARGGGGGGVSVVSDKEMLAASDVDELGGNNTAPSAASSSPADALGRMSLDDVPVSNRQSLDAFESGSYSPGKAMSFNNNNNAQAAGFPQPAAWNWDPRLRGPLRRGSNLSEEFTRGVEEEEVDWNGPISDDDEYEEPPRAGSTTSGLTPSAPNFSSSWRRSSSSSRDGLGLDMQQIPIAQPVAAAPTLDPIPDGSPANNTNSGLAVPPRPSPINIMPSPDNASSTHRSPSRASSRLSQSPYRSHFAGDRAKSPLGRPEDVNSSPIRLALGRQTSASVLAADDDEDEGLAISIGSRRGRRSSMLGRHPTKAEPVANSQVS
ncbi:CAMKK/ELM protein kinase [Kwoniella heveanensis BCC8398]|uniref:non-specific serine/threonine protein kinase n=1 Tax=Kwoniella heveanensis BCC8398 TaxID=1296120 RepID=A0A1B9GWR9_9TREE|nr:CAMKK/ELM protein kinase [Kwoniella heveanensis BCC8398]